MKGAPKQTREPILRYADDTVSAADQTRRCVSNISVLGQSELVVYVYHFSISMIPFN